MIMSAKTSFPTARELFFPAVPHHPETLEELEKSFFGSLRQRNGTYKYTYANRLDDLNDLVAGLLPSHRPLRLMDVAASSGITTLDWANSLHRQGIHYAMTAGDINLRAYLLSVGKHLHVLADGTGYPLQYDIFGHAVPNPPARRMLALCLPWILLLKLAIARNFECCRRSAIEGEEHENSRRKIGCRTVSLVSPRLLANDHIELIEDDISTNQTIHGRYHVIRAANILNRDYFDEPTIVAIVANLRQRLAQGGLLVVCSTTGDHFNNRSPEISNDGTVFVLRGDNRFEVAGQLGKGSALEGLVLGLQGAERLS
jgi:hypothetical protein